MDQIIKKKDLVYLQSYFGILFFSLILFSFSKFKYFWNIFEEKKVLFPFFSECPDIWFNRSQISQKRINSIENGSVKKDTPFERKAIELPYKVSFFYESFTVHKEKSIHWHLEAVINAWKWSIIMRKSINLSPQMRTHNVS